MIYVTSDNSSGGRLAAQELHELGCQRVVYIGGYQDTPSELRIDENILKLNAKSWGKSV